MHKVSLVLFIAFVMVIFLMANVTLHGECPVAEIHRRALTPLEAKGTMIHTIQVVRTYPHDPSAFTQGLFYYNGYLYESTGLYGFSSIRKVELHTGRVVKIKRLPHDIFGEGITMYRDTLIQLTWLSGTGFVYDMRTFRVLKTFTYSTEGWGVTCDGESIIMSDGSSRLRFLDPHSYTLLREIEVHDQGISVSHLNELEYVKGEIYANVWGTDYIVRICPRSGAVKGWIDLRDLHGYLGDVGKRDVLNGIAYDPKGDRLFVTGKYWPKLFEITLKRDREQSF